MGMTDIMYMLDGNLTNVVCIAVYSFLVLLDSVFAIFFLGLTKDNCYESQKVRHHPQLRPSAKPITWIFDTSSF